MAIECMIDIGALDKGWILAPERYDPRRLAMSSKESKNCTSLDEVAELVRNTVNPKRLPKEHWIVLDTSNSREGVIVNIKGPVTKEQIGSSKKRLEPGDVIVSRLRPYLRQVAFVDDEILGLTQNCRLVCSTEFFILRSRTKNSIAFLVPFLLSSKVQSVFAASQEGGHHPRFNESTLMGLGVPKSFMKERNRISEQVELAVKRHRESERLVADTIAICEKASERRQNKRAIL